MLPRLGGRRGLLGVLVVLVVVLAGSAAVTGALGSLQQPTGDEVLDRVEQRYESAETVTSTARVTVENETTSTTATVEVAAAADNRSRTIVTHDGTTYRTGSNGSVVWAVGPNHSAAWPVEAVEAGAAPDLSPTATGQAGAPGESDAQLSPERPPEFNESNVSATLVGTPTVDGISTYEVELTHPEVDATTSLWVAQDDYRVVRAVTTDGTNRTVVAVESTAFNVSIHESTFEPPNNRIALTPHDQYDDFAAAQQATDLSLPRLDGTFAEASVTVRQNETIVGQRYVTDDGNVSIVSTTATDRFDRVSENASTTTIDGQTVTVTTAEDRAIAAWTDDGVTTAVVVEGSTDRAVAVAGDLSR
ncbi:DUF2092 domain-containing protein [Halobellus marinus]|uniref:DUF2092 domain-containing protein n=1 Tax=Halobellus TaxID=1073986 RepID=UPI0028A78B1B|nr:DUF2092 domain-containing protein [Halobellus sp. DFY28]